VAYEIDPALAARLPRLLRDHPNVTTVRGDFLRARPPREPFAVVGNIPYARTSDIVRWCLAAPTMTSATLLTQLEYARKRTGGYGRWSLVTVGSWPEYIWRFQGRVGRASFTPVPRTDSGLLRIERRPRPLLPAGRLPAYRDFVAYGFTGVGGSLAATLARRHRARRVRAVFAELRLDVTTPVGLVPPAHWIELFRRLT
jgi:23S rRNA (adenine-N6)-dimethyltransferase